MKNNYSIVIVTGLSGAGKSTAIKALEDSGYYAVDNLPLFLAEKFFQMAFDLNVEIPKLALVIDVRNREFEKALSFVEEAKEKYGADILFLDAKDNILINRYKETRRKHPLGNDLVNSIKEERRILSKIRDLADFIIDTSTMNTNDLSAKISELFADVLKKNMMVVIQSFGFKYGIPPESDMVFDVRFLKNPHYVDDLRHLTGLDEEVYKFVFSDKRAKRFLKEIRSLLNFLIPNYIMEGKKYLTISIGCTGGKHRSVAIAKTIYEYMMKKTELNVSIKHRDIKR